MKTTNERDVQSFLVGCHVATNNLLSLAESLQRSVKAIEFQDATDHPDRILIQLLVERIGKLSEEIGDFL